MAPEEAAPLLRGKLLRTRLILDMHSRPMMQIHNDYNLLLRPKSEVSQVQKAKEVLRISLYECVLLLTIVLSGRTFLILHFNCLAPLAYVVCG